MPELVAPNERLRVAWLEAHAEWGPGLHEDGFGLSPCDEVVSAEGFAAWITDLVSVRRSDPALTEVGQSRVLSWWLVEKARVLGGVALRVGDDDHVQWAGHVGFRLRPSARGRGLGTWALRSTLDQARTLGRQRVLAVCAVDNAASAKTIERCGGVLEEVRPTPRAPRGATGSLRELSAVTRADTRAADGVPLDLPC